MTEVTIYKCDFCGAKFDNEYEASWHEWVCRYSYVKKKDSSLYFYNEDGKLLKFDNQFLVDEVAAFTVSNEYGSKFIAELFEWCGYDNPFRAIANDKNVEYCGLWWFNPDLHYGEWVRVDDQIKKWTDIKNKFSKDA